VKLASSSFHTLCRAVLPVPDLQEKRQRDAGMHSFQPAFTCCAVLCGLRVLDCRRSEDEVLACYICIAVKLASSSPSHLVSRCAACR
jgi:hypothetical protein